MKTIKLKIMNPIDLDYELKIYNSLSPPKKVLRTERKLQPNVAASAFLLNFIDAAES